LRVEKQKVLDRRALVVNLDGVFGHDEALRPSEVMTERVGELKEREFVERMVYGMTGRVGGYPFLRRMTVYIPKLEPKHVSRRYVVLGQRLRCEFALDLG